jgi:hypothetical protein
MNRRLAYAATFALAAGCTFVPETSNQPDSGVDCATLPQSQGGAPTNVPLGTGSVTGELAFTVGTAYEQRDTVIWGSQPDGGPSTGFIGISLYDRALSCAGLRAADAGLATDVFGIYLYDPGQLAFAPGHYPVSPPDGGPYATAFRTQVNDAGVLSLYANARSGDVTVTSRTSCFVEGSFSLAMALLDGGTASTSGTFNSAFCR